MAARQLNAEERALWERVIASVTPLVHRPPAIEDARPPAPEPVGNQPLRRVKGRVPPAPQPQMTAPAPRPSIGETLDGGWDKRLTRGNVMPDFAVDLHGHTLDSAYRLLDASLDRAVRSGARVVLLITGKPPRERGDGGNRRGAIRAAVGDWLGASRFAAQIAAVRGAHPRHGGSGALYIIFRRERS